MVILSWDLENIAVPVCVQMALRAADSLLGHVIRTMTYNRCIVYATRAIKVISLSSSLVLLSIQSCLCEYRIYK